MDFTLTVYRELLVALQGRGYGFQAFKDFLRCPAPKAVVLRHDIDRLPNNAVKMARLERGLGVAGTYFFRVVTGVWDEDAMARIAAWGHEIGYHYEDLALTGGDSYSAILHFEFQLNRFHRIYPVETICMHGSPLSRHDNRDLWRDRTYREFGIVGEPYFDVDFHKVFYLTDTGRKWNNAGASLRDKVDSGFDIPVKSTAHLITLAGQGALPDQIMITIHPQRWHDRPLPWAKELVLQRVKNVAKAGMVALGKVKGERRRGGGGAAGRPIPSGKGDPDKPKEDGAASLP